MALTTRALTFQVVAGSLVLSGCSLPVVSPPSPVNTSSMSCTEQGTYQIRQGIDFSEPDLPASSTDPTLNPKLGIIGIFAAPEPAAVTLMVTRHGPEPLPNFKEPELGSTASFYGYTVKITSICSSETRFDLITAP